MIIDHPKRYTKGLRVMFLKARHKDGFEQERTERAISHNTDEFERQFARLLSMHRPNERIYVSATPRSLEKARREFRRRQLEGEYDQDPMSFYRQLENQWYSALMAPTSQTNENKCWLFDADNLSLRGQVVYQLRELGIVPEEYKTKGGWHFITPPFDRSKLWGEVELSLDTNAMMLWAY